MGWGGGCVQQVSFMGWKEAVRGGQKLRGEEQKLGGEEQKLRTEIGKGRTEVQKGRTEAERQS